MELWEGHNKDVIHFPRNPDQIKWADKAPESKTLSEHNFNRFLEKLILHGGATSN